MRFPLGFAPFFSFLKGERGGRSRVGDGRERVGREREMFRVIRCIFHSVKEKRWMKSQRESRKKERESEKERERDKKKESKRERERVTASISSFAVSILFKISSLSLCVL